MKWLGRVLLVFLFSMPLLWMVAAALQPQGVALGGHWLPWPANATLANFGRIFRTVPLWRYTLNSLRVTAIAVPLTLLTASWAGFAMSQMPARQQRRWLLISLMVLMVPGVALWTSRFLIYRWLGWLDTYWALVAPAWMGSSPFFVLVYYRAFRRIPQALFDAARLEGAGVLANWAWVAMPAARRTTVGVAMLTFLLYWGDFIHPLLYLGRDEGYTLPIALQLLAQMDRSDWSLLMAAAVWSTLIPLLLFGLAGWYLSREKE